MPARIVAVCDAVAAAIAAALPVGDLTVVARAYLPAVDMKTLAGRTVSVFPLGYGQAETLTRAQDLNDYRIGLVIAERHTDAGEPTVAWADARLAWVETQIYDLLSSARTAAIPAAIAAAGVYPETADVVQAYDPDFLREHKLFWSEATITFRRDE